MGGSRVTRGLGLLEPMLAKLRARMANKLMREDQRAGRILDVGCGSYPFFLSTTRFAEKHGVDKMASGNSSSVIPGITLHQHDFYKVDQLPYPTASIDVVTMLAVFEHVQVERLIQLITDIHRVLKPGGVYIMTTPAGWTGPLLTMMKIAYLVSPEEVNEHVDSYSRKKIRAIMASTPFVPARTRLGYFELGMNVWMVAAK